MTFSKNCDLDRITDRCERLRGGEEKEIVEARDQEIARVLDEYAIRKTLLQYCRAIDRRDEQLLRSCYHSDATDSHGEFSGAIQEFMVWVFDELAKFEMTMHFMGNVNIEFIENQSDIAVAESYALTFHRSRAHRERNWVAGVRYVDRFERRTPGSLEWKIAARTVVGEWLSKDPVEYHLEFDQEVVRGERDNTDVLYKLIEALKEG